MTPVADPPPRTGIRLLAAAAVALIVAVGGAAVYQERHAHNPRPVGRTIALRPGLGGGPGGTATVYRNGLLIKVPALRHPAGSLRYEVWLTDAAGSARQPVGWLNGTGSAWFYTPNELTQTYSRIEISIRDVGHISAGPNDDDPGTAVLSGRYR